jgi:hypothetical protein
MSDEELPELEPPGEGRDRKSFVLESALGPNSLCGSWVLGFEGDDISFQGLVVGEPQSGVYVVEVFDQIDSESKARGGKWQKPMHINEFLEGDYRFFDTDVWVMRVLDAYQASKRSEV